MRSKGTPDSKATQIGPHFFIKDPGRHRKRIDMLIQWYTYSFQACRWAVGILFCVLQGWASLGAADCVNAWLLPSALVSAVSAYRSWHFLSHGAIKVGLIVYDRSPLPWKKEVVLEHFVSHTFLHTEAHLNPLRLSRDCHLILRLFYGTSDFPKVPVMINEEACAHAQTPTCQSLRSFIPRRRSLFAPVITLKVGVKDRMSQKPPFSTGIWMSTFGLTNYLSFIMSQGKSHVASCHRFATVSNKRTCLPAEALGILNKKSMRDAGKWSVIV